VTDPAAATPPPDARHLEAVRADYNARVGQWQTIYDTATYHDWLIQDRLERTLRAVDAMPVEGRALDAGCGAGQLAAELGGRGYELHATDLAEGMVEAAQATLAARGVQGEVIGASVHDLPYPDDHFKVVTALGLIEYLEQPAVAVRELGRVLAPGGLLVVTAPNKLRLNFLMDPIGVLKGLTRQSRPGYDRRYLTAFSIRAAVKSAGLAIVDQQGHGFGGVSVGGKLMIGEDRAIALDRRLDAVLPKPLRQVLGANLIVTATKAG
jgi:2-polyprenyl-3-methyl-5-hydroxy-6-metoxy-1,4-benzoquinol methylase